MKTYHLKSGDTVVASGPTPPEYDLGRRAYLIGGMLISTADPDEFTVEVEDVPTYRTVMTPLEFKGLFTLQERFAIETARTYTGTDATAAGVKLMLNIFFSDIDDVRTTRVDVADPRVIGGLDFCAQQTFITAESAAAKKLGIPE